MRPGRDAAGRFDIQGSLAVIRVSAGGAVGQKDNETAIARVATGDPVWADQELRVVSLGGRLQRVMPMLVPLPVKPAVRRGFTS